MPELDRVRYPYAACRSMDAPPSSDTYVLGPDSERVCIIPHQSAPWMGALRTRQERWDIAATIARLLNEESERCRIGAEAVRVEDMKVHG